MKDDTTWPKPAKITFKTEIGSKRNTPNIDRECNIVKSQTDSLADLNESFWIDSAGVAHP